MPDNTVFNNLSPAQLLGLTAYGEARGEGSEGMAAVINVIYNRTRRPDIYALTTYPSVWHGVILMPKQFSIFNASDPSRPRMEQIASNFEYYRMTDNLLNVAYNLGQMAVTGILEDNTGGATNYHATYVSPAWSKTLDKIGQIGNHIFYSAYSFADRIRTGFVETTRSLGLNPAHTVLGIIGIGALLIIWKRRRK